MSRIEAFTISYGDNLDDCDLAEINHFLSAYSRNKEMRQLLLDTVRVTAGLRRILDYNHKIGVPDIRTHLKACDAMENVWRVEELSR